MMADQGGGGGGSGVGVGGMRDYRKGNWTVSETMVLIEAKRMDEERRTKRGGGSGSKPAELRWKWVEDYCWRKGCFRSQNQCNDKWDNLMRDYKKLRDYHRRLTTTTFPPPAPAATYWKLEKKERKERNLPTNMLLQIYDALVDVVERRGGGSTTFHPRLTSPTSGENNLFVTSLAIGNVMIDRSTTNVVSDQQQQQEQEQEQPPPPLPLLMMTSSPHHQIPPPQPLAAVPLPPPPLSESPRQQSPTMCGDGSSDERSEEDYSGSPSPAPNKRMRTSLPGGGGTAASSPATSSAGEEGDARAGVIEGRRGIWRIVEAIEACEQGQERRHREMVRLQERRLKMEESKAEMTRHGLVDAINKLANSILALASSSSSSSSSPPPPPPNSHNNSTKTHNNPSTSTPPPH
ncbi:unnamed protein product [Linum trigynum]|uniref:Myb-like domain-containing protein n=1 Tax=Linum trigynum TaxID=586398 RepID=A0AAV2FVK9_9ROSI